MVVLVALAAIVGFAANRLAGLGGVDERGADVTTFEIQSHAVGEKLDTAVVVPDSLSDVHRPPLLVFLHGRGGEEGSEASNAFFEAMDALGPARRSWPCQTGVTTPTGTTARTGAGAGTSCAR